MRATVVAFAVLAGLLTACSSGGATTDTPPSIEGVIDTLMDDGLPIQTVAPRKPGLFARQTVDVIFDVNGDRIEGLVHIFGNLEGRDAWIEAATTLGRFGITRDAELWVVNPDGDLPNSAQIAGQLAETIDGTVN
jgi:hypothetical protein